MRNAILLSGVLCWMCLCAPAAFAQKKAAQPQQQKQGNMPAGLKVFESPYYHVYTDINADSAREAVIRMTKMAEAYHERTAAFSGVIREKLPFYLFDTGEEYHAAGGMVGSAGVFDGRSLMAMAIKDREGHIAKPTWHVVQHEGFHQFVHAVIRGDIPTWTNEGLAEYFGEGIFTGDGFITGIIPPQRLKRIKSEIADSKYKPFPKIMFLDQKSWNAELGSDQASAGVNYDEAWSMVQFLAHGENGKYQKAFSGFMYDVGRGQPWEKAWQANVGTADGFEDKWKAYWTGQPENPTINLYAQASVAMLTSFVGRAYTQKQTFDNFEELTRTDPSAMKAAPADWLPPSLFTDGLSLAKKLTDEGDTFAITTESPKNKLPQITCTLPDGSKLVGRFAVRGLMIGKVDVEIVPVPKPAPAKK